MKKSKLNFKMNDGKMPNYQNIEHTKITSHGSRRISRRGFITGAVSMAVVS